MAELFDTIVEGALLGGLYALFATGLSLSFGIMRLVNIAHGDLVILAAYVALVVIEQLGLHPLASFVVVVPIMAAFGYGLQRAVLNGALGAGLFAPLLVTFGMSVIIQNLLTEVFSADTRGLDAGAIETASLRLFGDTAIGVYPLLVLGVAVAVIGGLALLFARTPLGWAFRATSDDPMVAGLMGIETKHVYGLAMMLAMSVVAIAGILFAIRTSFAPALGPGRLLFAFETVIIGGMGSLWGTLAGGMILGVSQSFGFRFSPGLGVLAGHIAFLAVLVLRPQGLFARTREL